MPRTLDAGLLAAMNSGVFTPYFKVQLLDANRTTVLHETTEVLGFELDGLTAKVSFHDPSNWQDFYTYRIVRGVLISGSPVTISSSNYYPLFDRHVKRIRTLEGHVFPNQFYSTPGDVTYSQVISAVCTHFGFSVVHETPGAAWLSYQFLPTGRTFVLNDAKSFFTFLRQKYLIFATDYGSDTLYFFQAKAVGPTWPSGYTSIVCNKLASPGNGALKNKSFLSRDENDTTHTSGSSSDPIHNLGFLPSTASQPTRTFFLDTNEWVVENIAPNLKYLDFDALKIDLDIISQALWPAKLREIFDQKMSPSWQWQARWLDVFGNTEAGAIPSTIMAAAPYTPINVSQFTKNLNTTQNNLQALADKVDDLTCGPAIYAATEDTAPLDLDILPIVDANTSTHLVRKLYWSTVKARFRDKLTANRAYYVRTDGHDTASGLNNTTDPTTGAFFTLQHAVDVVAALDLSIYSVWIYVADGTYTAGIAIVAPFVGSGAVNIQGNLTTPANVVINCTTPINVSNASLNIAGLKLGGGSTSQAIIAGNKSFIQITGKMEFGVCSFVHIYVTLGGRISNSSAYTISGSAGAHYQVESGGGLQFTGMTVTLTGSPAFSSAFAAAVRSGVIEAFSQTYSGAATGARYNASTLGNIFTNGGGANYFPGNSAGSVASGGQYN